MKKKILITHADVDHCGLLSDFDEILAVARTVRERTAFPGMEKEIETLLSLRESALREESPCL